MFRAIRDSGLPQVRTHLLLAIELRADYHTGVTWASQATLARDTRLHLITVRTALGELRSAGWIAVGRRYVEGRRTSSFLRVTPPGLALPPDPRLP